MARRAENGTAYEVSGPEGAPAVVLIHGLGLNRKTWREHAPALAGRYRVVTYDLLGHGESALPPARPSLALFSAQLLGLLDELGIAGCVLAGFSLGGMINRRFAIDHPARVRALAILNAPHERGAEAQRRVEAQAASSAAGGPAATLDAAIERWFTPAFRAARPGIIDEVRRWVLANDPAAYAQTRWVLAHGVLELIRPDPPIALPTLVMTCEHDSGSTPAMSRAIAAEIAGAETIIVPGLRHMGLIERPGLFTGPLLRFLDRVAGEA
jgi:pimeloyl-ACP methyl ester carboxylesterase